MIISQYFDKYRSIATGILASGTGLGVFAVAPILQALLDSFDWRKTYRITAGIFSVVCALCLTYDPTITKKGESQDTQGQNEEGDSQDTEGQNERLEYQDELEETTTETPSKCMDFSVFKEKVFVVLSLSMTVAFLGHHTPRLHLVRLCYTVDRLIYWPCVHTSLIFQGRSQPIAQGLQIFQPTHIFKMSSR